ncbi:zinc finger CCCH domain-containing protein 15-like [Rutidosis leptorrhynchoides]|uniref:zinc finger CCCH domain-containing protein 15-like n=1 Tax=Rutidosis leptorrhynchoides TaxID=125765 RepID=UPI003A9A4D92
MQSYSDFPYSGNDNGNIWSTFLSQPDGATCDDFDAQLYTSIFPRTLPPRHFSVPPNATTVPLSLPPIVAEYACNYSQDFAPFQDLIERRNWCLTNLSLSAKEAEALRQDNVNLQMANSELNKQLSRLQQQHHAAASSSHGNVNVSPNLIGDSVIDRFGRMRIGEKGMNVNKKQGARGVENVDPIKKTDVERVKLPKSISVRSNGYLKPVQVAGGSTVRARVEDRVKTASKMQRVYVRGKKEEQPLELQLYNQGMTKTELCNKWQQTGACPYGDHCQFAHGIQELRPVIRHPRYKTEVCRMVLAGDPCPYGHRCHFRHALTEEEKLMSCSINN